MEEEHGGREIVDEEFEEKKERALRWEFVEKRDGCEIVRVR